jgi:hypothetical protein
MTTQTDNIQATQNLLIQSIAGDLATKAVKAQKNLELFYAFPETFATTCWASDSKKSVWYCPCAQCKEIIQVVRDYGRLPNWVK